MLVHVLFLVLCWLVLSSALLLLVGRHLGASVPGSFVLLLTIEGAGGVVAVALGIPLGEVIQAVIISSGLGVVVMRAFPA